MKYTLLFIYFITAFSYGKNTEITLIIPDKKGPIFWDFVSDVSKATSKSLNLKLEIIYSGSNRFALKSTIENILKREKKPDYLIFRPFLGNTGSVFDLLEHNKIKFVTLEQAFYGRIEDKLGSPQQKYQYWLGQINYDNKAGGELLLNALIKEKLKRHPDNMVYITGIGGDFDKVSKDREDVFNHLNKIEHHKKIVINQIIPMHWDPNHITERFPSLKKRYPNTNVYWCAGDQLALKILQLTNDPKNIVIGGFDWLPVILEKIQQKEITASVGGHFLMVAIALVNIVDYEAGQNVFIEYPKLYKFELITAENVDSHISFFNNKGWNKADFSHYLTSKNKHAPLVTISNLMEQVNQNE